jgi:hypothetical protein
MTIEEGKQKEPLLLGQKPLKVALNTLIQTNQSIVIPFFPLKCFENKQNNFQFSISTKKCACTL